MELFVYDKQLNPIGIIDEVISCIWTPTYWEGGTFQDCKILAPVTSNNTLMLEVGNLVVLKGERADFVDEGGEWRRAFEITYKHIQTNAEGMEQIEVQGCFLKKWLNKRVISAVEQINDTNQNIINYLVRKNCGDNAEIPRRFQNFQILSQDNFQGEVVDFSTEYGQYLGDIVAERSALSKLGFDILVNEREKKYGFWLYKGLDLSGNNAQGNSPCIFSRDYDNVSTQEYTDCIESDKNVAYSISAVDDNGNTFSVEVLEEGELIGIDRKEEYVNNTSISWKTDDKVLSQSEYIALMQKSCVDSLEEDSQVTNFTSVIDTSANLKYKEDFRVGDIVTSIEKRWNIRIDARITKISQAWQNGKSSIEITFGDSLPTLLDKLRK